MYTTVNFVDLIREMVLRYFYAAGVKPKELLLSPRAYRRLLEQIASELPASKATGGLPAVTEMSTPLGSVLVTIDELLPDMDIAFA